MKRLSFYNEVFKIIFTFWKERTEKYINIKGTPEDIWKDLLFCMKYDFEFLVEDTSNTVTSNCFITLISKYLFSVAIRHEINYGEEDSYFSLAAKCFST